MLVRCEKFEDEAMPKRQASIKGEKYIEQAIVQLLSLKIRAGSSLSDVRTFAQRCLAEAGRSAGTRPKSQGLGIHRLGSVLRTWHTESPYLTFDGLPRALPTSGRLSLKSLIRKYYAAPRVNLVFQRMIEASLIRRNHNGEWIPVGRSARIAQVSLESLEHVSQGIVRYVETTTRNVTAKREQDLLFERSCQVTNLPMAELDEFRQYVDQQAIAFLTAVDDWLESRSSRAKRSKTRRCTAGVHAFAFVTGNPAAKPSRTK